MYSYLRCHIGSKDLKELLAEWAKLWFSDAPADHPVIAELLKQMKIFTDLTVTSVKNVQRCSTRRKARVNLRE